MRAFDEKGSYWSLDRLFVKEENVGQEKHALSIFLQRDFDVGAEIEGAALCET